MKTSLDIGDSGAACLLEEAARSNQTMSELVEAGLRLLLESGDAEHAGTLPPPCPVSTAVNRSRMWPTARRSTRPWRKTECSELPQLRDNVVHDAHTAVLMREHGIHHIITRDTDFYRFPFLTVTSPVD